MIKIGYLFKCLTSRAGHLTGISTGARICINHWKSTWWIKLLTVFFVLIIPIALCVQFTRTPKIPATPANWLYIFLDDWSIVLSAAAMGLLAIAAFLAILDNRNAKKLDIKERLLNEIIDWALEIQTSSLTPTTTPSDIANLANPTKTDILLKHGSSLPKNEYILSIASITFKEEKLETKVEIVITNFLGHLFFKFLANSIEPLDAMRTLKEFSPNIPKDLQKEYAYGDKDILGWINEYRNNLTTSIRTLLLHISEIKTNLLKT